MNKDLSTQKPNARRPKLATDSPEHEETEPANERAEWTNEYKLARARLQEEWRDRILQRDLGCVICGETRREYLSLAHITTCRSFLYASKGLGFDCRRTEDLEKVLSASYRPDNLVILCSTCHKVQHGAIRTVYEPTIKAMMEEKQRLLAESEAVRRYQQLSDLIREAYDLAGTVAADKSRAIATLFDRMKKQRSWTGPRELLKAMRTDQQEEEAKKEKEKSKQ